MLFFRCNSPACCKGSQKYELNRSLTSWVLKLSSPDCHFHKFPEIVHFLNTQESDPSSLSLFWYPHFSGSFVRHRFLIWPRILANMIWKNHTLDSGFLRSLFSSPSSPSRPHPNVPSHLQMPLHLSKILTFGKKTCFKNKRIKQFGTRELQLFGSH